MAGKRRSGLANHRRAYPCCKEVAPNTFTVTYNGNTNTGGTVPTDGSSPYESGTTVTVLGNSGSLANTGFTFAGWNTEENGSGTSYVQGNTFTITSNIILYAKWTTIPPPNAPTDLSSVPGNREAYILFNQIGTVTNYAYSTDGGATYLEFNPPQIYSPVNISTLSDGVTLLTNGDTYTVQLKAIRSGVSSIDSESVDVIPTTTSLLNSNERIIYLDASNSSSYPGSGTTWTNLESEGAYSATLVGSPTYDASGYFKFNEGSLTGQYAQINQAPAINPVVNKPFTIQVWAKINNIGTQGTLVSKMFGLEKGYDGYNLIYLNQSENNKLKLHLNGLNIDTNTNPTFQTNTDVLSRGWALYTATIQFGNSEGRKNKLFVDGRQVLEITSTETSIPNTNQNLTLAGGHGGCGECDIGEFYYYDNVHLSTYQIIQNFDATKHRYM